MGQFSFVTADTHRSIPTNGFLSDADPMPVYLLRPGKEPLLEPFYEGYGEFGGVDVYEWMAEANAEHLQIDIRGWESQRKRVLGIFLDDGRLYRDTNGQLWAVFEEDYEFFGRLGVRLAPGDYAVPLVAGGQTPNELRDSGEWEELTPAALGLVAYHIKITEKPLPYEAVPASTRAR